VHFHGDVVQGGVIGENVIARLDPNPAFRADFEPAESELAALGARSSKSLLDRVVGASALSE
jgi:hypothetical protein